MIFAGAGFADLAWTEAKRRAEVPLLPRCFTPNRVHAADVGMSSWHYYEIIRNAEIGVRIAASARKHGETRCVRVRL